MEDGFACELNEWKQCFVEASIEAVGSKPGCIFEDCRCSRSLLWYVSISTCHGGIRSVFMIRVMILMMMMMNDDDDDDSMIR